MARINPPGDIAGMYVDASRAAVPGSRRKRRRSVADARTHQPARVRPRGQDNGIEAMEVCGRLIFEVTLLPQLGIP